MLFISNSLSPQLIESVDNDNVHSISSAANKLNTGGGGCSRLAEKDNTSSGRHSLDSGSSTDEEEGEDNNADQGEEEEDSEDNQDKEEEEGEEEEGEKNHRNEGADNDDLSGNEDDEDESEAQTGRTTRATESTCSANKHSVTAEGAASGNKEESRKLSTTGCGNKRKSSSPSKSIASVTPAKMFKGSGDIGNTSLKGKKVTTKTSGKACRKQATPTSNSCLSRGRGGGGGGASQPNGVGAMLSVPTSMVPPATLIDGSMGPGVLGNGMQQQQAQGGQAGGGGPQLTQAAFAAATAALATAAAAAGMPVNQLLSQVGVPHKY